MQFNDVSQIIDAALALIFERLSKPAPHIRETDCVYALLLSVMPLSDECTFAAPIPAIGQRVVEIGKEVNGVRTSPWPILCNSQGWRTRSMRWRTSS
jgi:hypothetical protein